jgi:tRNA dimethylallyltransferase
MVAAVVAPAPTPSAPTPTPDQYPLLVIAGPTASGKTALALHLAENLHGEIVSCDAVAVFRGLDIGSAKPTPSERARVPHHALDLLNPDEPSTAGDYARAARSALAEIKARNHLPIVTGGSGLYLRALLEGLAPAPPRDESLRTRLRLRATQRGPAYLHRLLQRLDPAAAALIHPNDTPKLIRSLEVTVAASSPQTEQWQAGRDPLQGFRTLQLGLNPPRAQLYTRINARASRMFTHGLLEETAALRTRFGDVCRVLNSLGYAQALAVLRNELSLEAAIAAAQQGHRNYAKRQLTWFRRDPNIHWLPGFGDDASVQATALALTRSHLQI